MGKLYTSTVPLWMLDGSEGEIEVEFEFVPGTPESGGWGGPPENYDPGSGDEFYITRAWYLDYAGEACAPCLLADHELEKAVEYLNDEWMRPELGPDPDDERDRRIDDELTERRP